ncbi:MAG: hypothetical protein MR729_01235 [Dorea sp.]|nr:hypothetical protein [Dorea sp.]
MKKLWEMVCRYFGNECVEGIFLGVNIIRWTIGTLVLGLFFCVVTGTDIVLCIANLMCVAIYAGIIMGLFGGIFFLMRK